MQAQHLATLFTKLLLIAIFTIGCENSAGENAKEFMDMCTLYTLLTQPIHKVEVAAGDKGESSQSPETKMNAVVDKLTKMNLTLAPTEVAAHFKATDPATGWKALPETHELKVYFGKEADLDNLNKQYDELMGDTGTALRREFELPIADDKKKRLRKPAAHLTKESKALQQVFNGRLQKLKAAREQARIALITALAGTEAATALTPEQKSGDKPCDPIIDDANFPWKASAKRDGNCAKAASSDAKAGVSIAGDIVCLCHSEADNSNTACTHSEHATGTQISADGSAAKNANANWRALQAKCTEVLKGHELHLSPATLSEALAAFKNRLGTNMLSQTTELTTVAGQPVTQPTFYGVYVSKGGNGPTCRSASFTTTTDNTGVCINYAELFKPGKEITWISSVKNAQKHLQEAEALSGEIKALLSQAHNLQNQMESLLLMGNLLAPAANAVNTATRADQKTAEEQNKCKNVTNKTAEGCASVNCDYDVKKKECKPKARSETSEAGAGTEGETQNAGGKKCSDKKKQEDCKDGANEMEKNAKITVFSSMRNWL
uniref:Variant surface glycoprotein 677 n=1 Tax=Trypanosoma brucei TaxID=5691 RepID=M4SV48_9TRYP|nr:variant surface glycoprotein 677 [Trypanosoma brucei]